VSTLNDVAKLAGVSTMTVSRVINGSGYTSPESRERVNRAIAEMGYMPNALARQLRSKRTKTLALVMTDIANPFFTTIARGVEDAARPRGYAVMFCNTDESADLELEYVRVLIQRRVDGVLLVPAADSSTSLDLLRTHKLPAVVLDRRLRSGDADEIRADSEGGAYVAVRHLIDLGHRQIAVLAGPESVSTSADRVSGYRRAMLEAWTSARHLGATDGDLRRQQLHSLRRDTGAPRVGPGDPGRHVHRGLRRPPAGMDHSVPDGHCSAGI
jgi:LacI family transcriptional regulator